MKDEPEPKSDSSFIPHPSSLRGWIAETDHLKLDRDGRLYLADGEQLRFLGYVDRAELPLGFESEHDALLADWRDGDAAIGALLSMLAIPASMIEAPTESAVSRIARR